MPRRTTWVLAIVALFGAAFGVPATGPAGPCARYEVVYAKPGTRKAERQPRRELSRPANPPERPARAAVSQYDRTGPVPIPVCALFQRPPPAALLSRG
jgi:hypothetical protein